MFDDLAKATALLFGVLFAWVLVMAWMQSATLKKQVRLANGLRCVSSYRLLVLAMW